jgi:hypothetical protein
MNYLTNAAAPEHVIRLVLLVLMLQISPLLSVDLVGNSNSTHNLEINPSAI